MLDYAKQQQKLVLPIFQHFYETCLRNDIGFSMCEGSLLGCVRHSGFVPWDDDIDVYMSLVEFGKLKEKVDQGFILYSISSEFYTYSIENNEKKIDIFLNNFSNKLYQNFKFVESRFEEFRVKIPENSIDILNKTYKGWNSLCYISNHKIGKEIFKTSYGYKESLTHRYKQLPLETALQWIEGYHDR